LRGLGLLVWPEACDTPIFDAPRKNWRPKWGSELVAAAPGVKMAQASLSQTHANTCFEVQQDKSLEKVLLHTGGGPNQAFRSLPGPCHPSPTMRTERRQ